MPVANKYDIHEVIDACKYYFAQTGRRVTFEYSLVGNVKAPTIDHNPSLKEILDERGREFLGENWRRNDMIRFGTFEGQFFPHYTGFPTANFDKTRRIFPVHKDILNVNPTWKQNPGY